MTLPFLSEILMLTIAAAELLIFGAGGRRPSKADHHRRDSPANSHVGDSIIWPANVAYELINSEPHRRVYIVHRKLADVNPTIRRCRSTIDHPRLTITEFPWVSRINSCDRVRIGRVIASNLREVSDRLSDRDRAKKLTLGYPRNFVENHDG
jgi:hypothetical protein